jgi:TonB family protein
VKRLLFSIILALGFHAIILSTDLSWLELAPQPTLKSKSMAIVLSTVKSQEPRSEADSLRMKQLASKKSAAYNEKQPEPSTHRKAEKNPDSVQNPAPIGPKKNLKALTLKKQTIEAVETVHSKSIDRFHFPAAAEAKIGSPTNSGTKPHGLPIAPGTALIKKTLNVPEGSSAPLTTAAAVPATETKEILSELPGMSIARPLYKQNPSPAYPLRARRMGYEGLVMLKVLVDENGRVDDLEVLDSSGYAILDKAAIASVKKWMFEPGTEGGKKKKMWVKIPIRFELE